MYDMLGGYLLLCCKLGNARRKVLSPEQFHKFLKLGTDVRGAVGMKDCPNELPWLLEDAQQMQQYAKNIPRDIIPLLLTDDRYPALVKERLKELAPGILWAKGNLELLNRPAVAVVGSRGIDAVGLCFATAVGRMAARCGYVLVSGNAEGADRAGQEACLEAGGSVISVVADTLLNKRVHDRILYLSENDYDLNFDRERALSRNQVIHSMGQRTYVAHGKVGRSGTWSGVARNLNGGWTPIYMHNNGSEAAEVIAEKGGTLVRIEELECL